MTYSHLLHPVTSFNCKLRITLVSELQMNKVMIVFLQYSLKFRERFLIVDCGDCTNSQGVKCIFLGEPGKWVQSFFLSVFMLYCIVVHETA